MNLIILLPPPILIVGNCNAEYIVWVLDHMDDRGTIVADIATQFNLTLLNTGANTHFCLGYGTSYEIDLVAWFKICWK